MGSPPAPGSKNPVLKFRSVSNIVIAPANTGSLRSNRIAVTSRDHTKSDIRSQVTPGDRMLKIVVMKLMAPRIDLIPAK